MRYRNLVVGDIHGSAKALEQVLERCKFDPMYDKLIQIGDVADGWGETSECVDILLDIKQRASLSSARHDNEPIFIRGNHDVWVYDWFKHGLTPSLWTTQGGKATLESYVRTGKLEDENHKNFWFKQQDWYIDDKNRLFIHAGWDYTTGKISWVIDELEQREIFERQASLSVNAGSIAKECHWDRSVLASAKAAFGKSNIRTYSSETENPERRFKVLEQFEEIYIGHTAIHGERPEPENYGNLWNVDTGAGWHGVLTIMDVDTKEYWQSDRSKDLYPDEKGR